MINARSIDGFSLSEMLVVLAIISLSALVVFNGYRGPKGTDTVGTMSVKIRQLAALVSLRAVSTGRTTSLVVDLSGQTVTGGQDQTPIKIPATFKLSVLTGVELTRQNVLAAIDFYNDGTSTGGEISVEDSQGAKQTVRILWLTGAIDIVHKGGS